MSLDSFFLQYRTFSDDSKNEYRGYLELSKAGNLIEESDIKNIFLEDSSGMLVAISETVFLIEGFYYANWNSSTSTLVYESFPQSISSFALYFPDGTEIPSGNYTYKVTTSTGDNLSERFYYPGREELPWVDSQDMESEWLNNGDLRLSWINPPGDYDQLRIFLLDQDGKLIFLVKVPTDMEELTIPSELVENINGYSVPTFVTWFIETRSYTGEGMNYARGVSDEVDIPWSFPSPDEGLVAYYPLDGNANDESGNGNDGVEYGNLSYVAGAIGQGASFDGIDDSIQVSHNDTLNPSQITIALWVYVGDLKDDDLGGLLGILDKQDYPGKEGYAFNFQEFTMPPWPEYDRYYSFYFFDPSGMERSVSSPENMEYDTWHHFVVTYDESILKMFHNGILVNSEVIDQPIQHSINDLRIGSISDYKPVVDEIRIYNRPLSAGAIYRLYEQR